MWWGLVAHIIWGRELAGQKIGVSEGEYKILKRMAEKGVREGTLDELSKVLGVDRSSLASIARLLEEKGLARVETIVKKRVVLTDKGVKALEEGLPEEKLVEYIASRGGEAGLKEIRDALKNISGIAIGQAKKKGIISIEGGRARLVAPVEEARERVAKLKRYLEDASRGKIEVVDKEALERGLVEIMEDKEIVVRLLGEPAELLAKVQVEVAKLSHDLLVSGAWRKVRLRPYDVRAEPPRVLPARTHFLSDFIEYLRDIMKELGFVEARGPLVEIELFNFDLLFQAQDHPAREIHDTLWIKEPRRLDLSKYGDLVERVARVHESGWRYKWNPDIAARLLLRSQTTSVSARLIAMRPEPPVRFFTVGRVFRSDVVDATHLPEFHQLDGIMGWPGLSFRDLLGLLREVAARLGFDLRLKPGYFPFTEPSVEGYVRLQDGRWLELFGAGLFRPEVLEAAGIDYPVAAWGFGVERLAAAYYGIRDIRELYTRDVDRIRSFPLKL